MAVKSVLLGGLGNQLFQLAAARRYASGGRVVLLDIPGFTGHSRADGPAISGLHLPAGVEVVRQGTWVDRAAARVGSRLMRESLRPIGLRSATAHLVTEWSSRVGILAQKDIAPAVAEGRLTGRGIRLMIGYWQSWHYAETLKRFAASGGLKPLSPSAFEEEVISQAADERPIIVHMRLGDYKSAPSFGVLTGEYYSAALEALEVARQDRIWVLSDEPFQARHVLGRLNSQFSFHFPELARPPLAATALLEILRWGRSYVIANSTISWWGAFLSHDATARVAAPDPWFATAPSPPNIVPPNWLRVPRFDATG